MPVDLTVKQVFPHLISYFCLFWHISRCFQALEIKLIIFFPLVYYAATLNELMLKM